MVDLYNHTNPLFTKRVVANGLLNQPFVVLDIGVQGGEHPRWQHLGHFAGFRSLPIGLGSPSSVPNDAQCGPRGHIAGRLKGNMLTKDAVVVATICKSAR